MKKTLIIINIFFFLSANLQAQISIEKEKGGFMILDGGKKVAFYQKEDTSMSLESGRNNFLHPVYLPDGTEITENAPEDHMHHRGIFLAWHQILINNRQICDPWMLKDFIADVKSIEFKRVGDGNGSFETKTFWKSPGWKKGKEAFLEENTTYLFYKQEGNYHRIKIDITLKSLTDSLKIGGSDDGKGYGGFSVRMKLPDDVKFTGAKGIIKPQTTAIETGNYVNISGSVGRDGKQGGILIYADPDNQPSPQTWILREKNSMQNAVFPGSIPIEIQKDVPLHLCYTVVLYSGKVNEKLVIRKITQE